MYTVSIKQYERYCLRLLLLKVRGCTSFQDIRTYNNIVYDTFEQTAKSRNLINSDTYLEDTLKEASLIKMPKQLRLLFATILVHCRPTNSTKLFNQFLNLMSEDYLQTYTKEISKDLTLIDIQQFLHNERLTLNDFNLPLPRSLLNIVPNLEQTDHNNMLNIAKANIKLFNKNQKQIFNSIIKSIYQNGNQKLHYIDGPGGSGKTFLYNTLIHYLNGNNDKVIACATTGLASTLLLNGNTYHSTFRLFPPINSESVCNINHNSSEADNLIKSKLIIIDEVTMATNSALEAIDKCLQDIMLNNIPFGGKTVIIGGDFRQCLPVIRKGNKSQILASTIKNSHLWHLFKQHRLTINMRTKYDTENYADWLLKLGNGILNNNDNLLEDNIIIPSDMLLKPEKNIVDEIFGQSINDNNSKQFKDSVILCTTNDDCQIINNEILTTMYGNETIYHSTDSICSDDDAEINNFPVEFLNSINISGLPPHELKLKTNCIVMLIRNISKINGNFKLIK